MTERLPQLLSVQRIWDRDPHSAFTDLLLYRGQWLCTFRASATHGNREDGLIRILASNDSVVWSPLAAFQQSGIDLRDPKLSVMPDGRLLLLVGQTLRNERDELVGRMSAVAFSEDGQKWTSLKQILAPGEWLWRITWHGQVGYGISYSYADLHDHTKPWYVKLFQTIDGTSYQQVTTLGVPGFPSEATVRFAADGRMFTLVRREAQNDAGAWFGQSVAPYTAWQWRPLGLHLDGPDFVVAENGVRWAAGRIIDNTHDGSPHVTALCELSDHDCRPVILLPSGGDNSYPGMVVQDKILWMSYYSSHEDKTAIYLAKIQLP